MILTIATVLISLLLIPLSIIYIRNWMINDRKTVYVIQESIEINRDHSTVFDHLVDFENTYPLGSIKRIELSNNNTTEPAAVVKLGTQLNIIPFKGPSPISVTVSDYDEQMGRFGWVWCPGALFPTFHHYFKCEKLGDGRCKFTNVEEFSGIAIPLLMNVLDSWRPQYTEFNERFKIRVESK